MSQDDMAMTAAAAATRVVSARRRSSTPPPMRSAGNVSPRTKENSPLQAATKNVVTDDKGKCTLKISKGSRIKKICVISDLHMGVNGSKTCGFKQNDDAFAAYLTKMLDELNYDLIVIAGDCFELWEPGPIAKNGLHRPMTQTLFKDIVASWPLTCEIIINCEHVILLNGNHDAYVRTKKMVGKCYADLIVEDFSLYVAHGHQSDIWCADDSLLLGVAQFATCLYGHVELIRHSMDEDVDAIDRTIKSFDTKRCEFRAMAHADMVSAALGCTVVSYGHTHNAMLHNTANTLYCNTGKCCTTKARIDQVDFALDEEADGARHVKADLLSVNVDATEQLVVASTKRRIL